MLTVVVRTLLFPLTFRQVRNMRRMQELKPDMDEIRKKYKDNPRRQQEETMKLYQERKVNPLGGCLPLLVQLPIFIALYYTIRKFDTLESFTSGGLLWFEDLTVADPYFILPVAYVLTMMASQHWTIRYTAPQQQRLMRILPIVFGFFLMRFPAGLFVYWISSNLITFVQNYLIYHRSPPPASSEDQKDTHPDSLVQQPARSVNNGDKPRASRRKRRKSSKGR
jgi:YidC/Oxa1 family membrane protein insertase